MRRLLLTSLGLLIAGVVLAISVLNSVRPAPLVAVGQAIATDAADVASQQVADYYLVYPGILPDHPLYWLKMVRDRVRLALVREPLARGQLKLLYADKRIGAAQFLSLGNKLGLSVTTAMKAEEYLVGAADELDQLVVDAPGVIEQWERLYQASLKHAEVLEMLSDVSVDEAGQVVTRAQELNRSVLDRAKTVLGVSDDVVDEETIEELLDESNALEDDLVPELDLGEDERL